MFTRSKALMGMTAAAVLITGVAWAANDSPTDGSATATVTADSSTSSTTVVQVEEAGTITLGSVAEGLTILAANAEAGWNATVEVPLGREVEARFESGGLRIDFNAELEDGEVRVRIRRSDRDGVSTTTTISPPTSTTVTTAPPATTSSTSSTTSTSSTSTTVDDNRRRTDIPEGVQVYEVFGAGSVTIDIRNGLLFLLGVEVESGWTFEIDKADTDDIRVEFESGYDSEAELRVRIRDGRLEVRRD